MIIKTRVFELCNGNYRNLSELAQAMELSVSQVYRVREGKRNINQKFIIGAKKAFPECTFEDLFYFASESSNSKTEKTGLGIATTGLGNASDNKDSTDSCREGLTHAFLSSGVRKHVGYIMQERALT